MAEQQLTQEGLQAEPPIGQGIPGMPNLGPEPKKKAAAVPAEKEAKGLPAPSQEKFPMFGGTTEMVAKQTKTALEAEPENFSWLSETFNNFKSNDTKYQDYTPQNRMKIEPYRNAFQVKNTQIKRHSKLIDAVVADVTEDVDIEGYIQKDVSGNDFLNKEKLRRLVVNKVGEKGGNNIVADFVYSKAARVAEDKLGLNKQKAVFDTKLATANIAKPKDADVVEKEFKDIQLASRKEMKNAQESVQMDFVSESNRVNDKYAFSINQTLAAAPYSMNRAMEEARQQLTAENYDPTGQYQYFEDMAPMVSEEDVRQRAVEMFEQNNADYLTTQYLPIIGEMQAEVNSVSKKYNTILNRKRQEIQAAYESKFSTMKAMNEKSAKDYNTAIEKLWDESGAEVKNDYERRMKETYDNMGLGETFGRKFTAAAGNMLYGIGAHLRSNGITGSAVDFLSGVGQYAKYYNSTYAPSLKDAYLSPKYWAGGVGELLGSSSIIAAATIATRNPYIGAVISNLAEGSSMAGTAYEDQIMKGKDPIEASNAASNVAKMNMLTMPLNALQARLFMPFTKGTGFTGAFKKLASGSAGSSIEEMFQSTFEEGEGFKAEKFYAPDTLEMGVSVFGSSMLMGIPGGAVSGLVDNMGRNRKIPSPIAQVGARMARENGPSRIDAVAETLNVTGEINDEQTQLMKAASAAIIQSEQDATRIGIEGDKKDAYVGISYDIKQLEAKKEQTQAPEGKAIIDRQIADKKQQLNDILDDKVELASVTIAGAKIVAPVEEVLKMMDTADFAESLNNQEVTVDSKNADVIAKLDGIKQQQAPVRQQNIISDTGEIIGQVPTAPAATTSDLFNQMTADEKDSFTNDVLDAVASFKGVTSTNKQGRQLIQAAQEGVRQNPVGELDKAIARAEEVLNKAKAEDKGDIFSSANIEASQNALNNLTQIKDKYATKISERQQQEVGQPSSIVQPKGVIQGQPEVGQAEGGEGQATQQAADARNRNIGSQAQQVEATAKALEGVDIGDGVSILKDKTSEGFYSVYKDGKFVGLLGATSFEQARNKGQYFDSNLMSSILDKLGIEHTEPTRTIQGENEFITIRTKGGSNSIKAVEDLIGAPAPMAEIAPAIAEKQQVGIKSGVVELFESNPELSSVGTPEQYSQYLDTIFPDSKIKDIVYHKTSSKEIEGGKFKISRLGGVYFSLFNVPSGGLIKGLTQKLIKENTVVALVDVKNPFIVNRNNAREIVKKIGLTTQDVTKLRKNFNLSNNDAVLGFPNETKDTGQLDNFPIISFNEKDRKDIIELAVFEPEQIRILGGKQDIEGFKEFIKQAKATQMAEAAPVVTPVVEAPVEAPKTEEQVTQEQLAETDVLLSGEAENRRKAGMFVKDGVEYKRNEKGLGEKGNTGEVRFTNDVSLPFSYKLVEANTLQPSHQNGMRNPLHFIPEAQPKNRNDEGSLQAEESFANNPRFDELGENTNAYSGAPIVNERNEVVQGNNRAAGLRKGYERGNQMYKDALSNNAEKFGFTRDQVQAMQNPVLVREVAVSDEGAVEVGNYDAKDLETGGKRRIDPVAVTRRMPFNVKGRLSEIFKGDETINESLRKNTKLVFDIVSPYLNQSQRNTLFKEGVLTEAGAKDLEAVVQHLLFDGGDVALPDLFDRMAHTQKEGLKKALSFIFSTTQEKSIVPEVQEAIIATNHYNESGAGSFDAWLAQPDMFNGARTPKDIYTPVAIEIARRMDKAKSQKEIAKVFADYANEVNDKAATMFEAAQPGIGKKEGIEKIFKVKYDETKKPTSIERGGRAIGQEPTTQEGQVAEPVQPTPIEKAEVEYNSRNLPNPIGEFDVVDVIPYTKREDNKFAPDQQLKFNQGENFEPVRIVGDFELIELIQIGARIRNNLSAKTKKPINKKRQQELEEKYGITASKANRRARELAKQNRGNIENIIIIGEKPTAPTEIKLDDLVNLDVKEPGNLEKIYNWLDNADKALGKQIKPGKLFDIGAAAGAGAIATAQAIVKALKAAVSATVSLKDAIAKVAKDFNITDNEVLNAVKTATEEQAKIAQASAKASDIGKKIKDFARGAKDAISTWRKASEALGKDIKAMVKDGTITTKQAANIIKKFGKVNILSHKSVGKFVDYMSKVFDDAEYENKLSTGKSTRKDISKLSKNKEKDANLREVGKRFLDIDPSMVDDIDAYNDMAAKIKESLAGSKRRKAEVSFASMVNIDDASNYIKDALNNQDQKLRTETAAEIQELMGIDVSEFSYDDMLALLEEDKTISKDNESIIRSTINKAFNIYSSVIKKALANGVDPFTDAPFEVSESQKDLINRFMGMDLARLTPKEALQAVDALNNFIQNKSTAKMESVVSDYTGRLNAQKVKEKGVVSAPLSKYFSKGLGRLFAEQLTNLGPLFERMFKGVARGGFVEDMSGLSKVRRGKATAETASNKIAKEYVELFYKQKANGEEFNSVKNMVERGMVAFLSRNVIGTQAERDAEFNRRKNIIKESIDALSVGSKKEQKKAKEYKEIYDKLGVKDAASAQEISSKADPLNVEAVNWWTDKWSEVYPQLSDLSQNVYNKILDKDTDYNPDRFKILAGVSKLADLTNEESAFHYNTGTVYKKETGVLMSATRPETLPKGKNNKPARYVDLSFDNNNANSLYDALIDINTAAAIRQVDAFFNSGDFNNIVPSAEDREVLETRVSLYIKKIRNKAPFQDDELSKGIRRLNNLAAVGVGQALGGVTQPFKQIIPVIGNTIMNAGRLDIGALLDKAKNDFISRSGYSIANRGVESQAQIESINRIIEVSANSAPQKVLRGIEKTNKMWLDVFLVKPDAWVARSSWITYYEESLKKQGIDPSEIDWDTHEVNEEAGNYAQRMIDRQQNVSDPAETGKLLSDSDNSFKTLFVKMAMPFASFRLNQSVRIANDLSTLSSISTSTKEDKITAARSLAGYAVETAIFRGMSIAIAIMIGNASKYLMGDDEDEKEKKERIDNTIKGQATSVSTELLSPVPVLDKVVQEGIFTLTDEVQNAMDISDNDKINIYKPKPDEFLKSLGLLGITADRAAQFYELTDLSAFDGEFEDKYGKMRKLRENDKEVLRTMIGPALASSFGLLPTEVNSVVRYSLRDAKKRAKVVGAKKSSSRLRKGGLRKGLRTGGGLRK